MEELFAPTAASATDGRRPHRYHVVGELTRRIACATSASSAALPWTAAARGDRRLERQLRGTITRLASTREAAFVDVNGSRGAPAEELPDERVEQAAAALEVDPDLSALRRRLVPRVVSEERFWQVSSPKDDGKKTTYTYENCISGAHARNGRGETLDAFRSKRSSSPTDRP